MEPDDGSTGCARETGIPTNRKKIQRIYRKIGWNGSLKIAKKISSVPQDAENSNLTLPISSRRQIRHTSIVALTDGVTALTSRCVCQRMDSMHL